MEGSIHVVGGAYGALRLSLLVEYPGELKVILWEQNILGFFYQDYSTQKSLKVTCSATRALCLSAWQVLTVKRHAQRVAHDCFWYPKALKLNPKL